MAIFKNFILALGLATLFLGPETSNAIHRGGVTYPYEQMRQWQKYPTTIDKPCNPYDKKGCPQIIIKK